VQEGLQRSTAQQENQIFTTKDSHRRCADANLPSFVLLNGVCTGGALTLVAFVFALAAVPALDAALATVLVLALAAVLAPEPEPTPPVTNCSSNCNRRAMSYDGLLVGVVRPRRFGRGGESGHIHFGIIVLEDVQVRADG